MCLPYNDIAIPLAEFINLTYNAQYQHALKHKPDLSFSSLTPLVPGNIQAKLQFHKVKTTN